MAILQWAIYYTVPAAVTFCVSIPRAPKSTSSSISSVKDLFRISASKFPDRSQYVTPADSSSWLVSAPPHQKVIQAGSTYTVPVAAAVSSCASSRHRAKLGALASAETVAAVFAHRLQCIYQIVALALAQLPDALVGAGVGGTFLVIVQHSLPATKQIQATAIRRRSSPGTIGLIIASSTPFRVPLQRSSDETHSCNARSSSSVTAVAAAPYM